jgi:hypothetical protein
MILNFIRTFLRKTFIDSALLLYVYKLIKFIRNKVLGQGSELERICQPSQLSIHRQQRAMRNRRIETLNDFLTKYFPFGFLQRKYVETGTEESQDLLNALNRQKLPYETVYRIDRSLLFSTKLTIQRRQLESKDASDGDVISVVHSIALKKRFRSCDNSTLLVESGSFKILFQGISEIYATEKLLHETSAKASTKYDPTNIGHEKKLMDLWNLLNPDTPLTSRLCTDWKSLGFQGIDPATDFRGMGILSLEQLIYFAKKHNGRALLCLKTSRDPMIWYQFALVGINITAFLLQLLRSRRLQIFLFQAMERWDGMFTNEWDYYRGFVNALVTGQNDQPKDNSSVSGSTEDFLLLHLKECFNELYCFVFWYFNEKWENMMRPLVEKQYADSVSSTNRAKVSDPGTLQQNNLCSLSSPFWNSLQCFLTSRMNCRSVLYCLRRTQMLFHMNTYKFGPKTLRTVYLYMKMASQNRLILLERVKHSHVIYQLKRCAHSIASKICFHPTY